MVVLQNLQDGMLEDMCGQKECDKVIVTSMGLSAVKQPTRQGLFFLFGWNMQDEGEKFPSYRWYHDINIPNVWNPKGNPWRSDDTIFVHCYNEKDWRQFECGCTNINITSTGRSREYHPDRLG